MNTKRRAHCQLWHDWKERIIRIGDEQTSLQNQFDNLRNEFTDNSPRIEALETNVNALDGRLIIAESDIAEVEDRVTACENDIDRIDAELVDKTGEINNLANRMSLAEANIDDIDARLEGIEAGEILLSQLVPDADKDMKWKVLSNVGIDANSVTVRGSQITPGRINNDILLWNGQEVIESEQVRTQYGNYTFGITDEIPYRKYISFTGCNRLYTDRIIPQVPVKPGSKVYASCYMRVSSLDYEFMNWQYTFFRADSSSIIAGQIRGIGGLKAGEWVYVRRAFDVPADAYSLNMSINVVGSQCNQDIITDIAGFRVYTDAEFDSDLSAKNISADAVIIKDGGTVDGVDISTHTHDGTAVGGPKISYNDLVDKPTIPMPPMPFKRSVSINLASEGDYIDVIPGTKYGRTIMTLERLQYRSIANILEGTGAFVVIGLIYDDDTVGTAIDRVTTNGDTDWHPPTYYGLNQTNQFTKNYIKGIRIERTPGGGPPITGYVDIIGYLY